MKRILFTLLFVLPLLSTAQESNLGNWLIYIGSKKLNDNWNLHNEIQYRNYNAIGDLEQLLIRTGLGYTLPETKHNFLLGYGYILSQNYSTGGLQKTTVHEHRVFQQFITKQKVGRVGIQHRYRFEQRVIGGDDFKLRFRYFLALNMPFNNRTLVEKTWYGSAYNEVFLQPGPNVFDRNRLYGGIGYKLTPALRLELGYMNQFFSAGGRDQVNLFAYLSF